jgi:hypothetical protein
VESLDRRRSSAALRPFIQAGTVHKCIAFAIGIGARPVAVMAFKRKALTPLLNRNSVTKPVVIWFLAFSNRNIVFQCYALKSVSAR